MTSPTGFLSGLCGARFHERCRGAYAGHDCVCACHQEPPEPEPEPVPTPLSPADRLERAAALLDRTHQPPPPGTGPALAQLLRAEATWAGGRIDTHPADRAPLLALADLILESAP